MTPRSFRAFWAISGPSSYVNALPRGGIDYEDILYIYHQEIDSVSLPGDYIAFDVRNVAWPNFALDANNRPKNGPIGVDQFTPGGAPAFCAGPLRTRIQHVVSQRMLAAGITSSYTGYVLMDLEDWTAYWRKDFRRQATSTYPANNPFAPAESHWRFYITEQRSTVLEGTQAYSDAAEEKYINSYMEIARLHHDTIFQAVRELLPLAKIGEYGWPQRYFYEFRPNHPTTAGEWIREANSLWIPRMSSNWDYISPWLYPPLRAVMDNGETPDPNFDTYASVWTAWLSRTCREYLRVQALCGGKPIICHVLPAFEVSVENVHFNDPLNDLTARLQLFLCRQHAFSGVIMWAAIPYDSTAQTRYDVIRDGLNLMQPHLKDFIRSMLGGVFLSGNSAIGIGTIQ